MDQKELETVAVIGWFKSEVQIRIAGRQQKIKGIFGNRRLERRSPRRIHDGGIPLINQLARERNVIPVIHSTVHSLLFRKDQRVDRIGRCNPFPGFHDLTGTGGIVAFVFEEILLLRTDVFACFNERAD